MKQSNQLLAILGSRISASFLQLNVANVHFTLTLIPRNIERITEDENDVIFHWPDKWNTRHVSSQMTRRKENKTKRNMLSLQSVMPSMHNRRISICHWLDKVQNAIQKFNRCILRWWMGVSGRDLDLPVSIATMTRTRPQSSQWVQLKRESLVRPQWAVLLVSLNLSVVKSFRYCQTTWFPHAVSLFV